MIKTCSCVFASFFFFRVHFPVAICHYLACDEKIEALGILIKSTVVIPHLPVVLFWELQVTWMLTFTRTSLLEESLNCIFFLDIYFSCIYSNFFHSFFFNLCCLCIHRCRVCTRETILKLKITLKTIILLFIIIIFIITKACICVSH